MSFAHLAVPQLFVAHSRAIFGDLEKDGWSSLDIFVETSHPIEACPQQRYALFVVFQRGLDGRHCRQKGVEEQGGKKKNSDLLMCDKTQAYP